VDTCLAVNSTPYYALTPELTRDYDERASLTSIRMIYSVVGYILGAALTTVLAGIFKGAGLNTQQAWSATGAVFGIVATITTLITTLSIKERPELAGEPSRLPASVAREFIMVYGPSCLNSPVHWVLRSAGGP
jgi:GPH family glycoside/pentoside/hexuronide:cation symporter